MWNNINANFTARAAMQQAHVQTGQQNQTIATQMQADASKAQTQRRQIQRDTQTRLHEMQSQTHFNRNHAANQVHNRVREWLRS